MGHSGEAVRVGEREQDSGPCRKCAEVQVPPYPARVDVKVLREVQALLNGLKTLNNQILECIGRR